MKKIEDSSLVSLHGHLIGVRLSAEWEDEEGGHSGKAVVYVSVYFHYIASMLIMEGVFKGPVLSDEMWERAHDYFCGIFPILSGDKDCPEFDTIEIVFPPFLSTKPIIKNKTLFYVNETKDSHSK